MRLKDRKMNQNVADRWVISDQKTKSTGNIEPLQCPFDSAFNRCRLGGQGVSAIGTLPIKCLRRLKIGVRPNSHKTYSPRNDY